MSRKTVPSLGRVAGQEKVEVYPPTTQEGRNRTLVLLFDGTGDEDDGDISNVKALHNMLYDEDPENLQAVFYKPGLGTHKPTFPGTDTEIPLISRLSKTADSAVAWSINKHIVAGYKLIMDEYKDGDKICMFGFSRGAYTARAVSGMIDAIGLLPKSHTIDQVWSAFDIFENETDYQSEAPRRFREKNNSRRVIIEFVGVWDTVSSVGALWARRLSNTSNNGSLKTFRHAVALDERRARFTVHMWDPPSKDPARQPHPVSTDVDQVWFAGAHCDVGGGSVPNGTRPNLAHIPLRWMVRECFKAKTGIMFKGKDLRSNIGISPESLYPAVETRPPAIENTTNQKVSYDRIPEQPGILSRAASWTTSFFTKSTQTQTPKTPDYSNYTEEELDLIDALAPIYDQLEMHPYKWGASELMPIEVYTGPYGQKNRQINYYYGRPIFPPIEKQLTDPAAAAARGEFAIDPRWAKIRVHRTVETRMSCLGDDGSPQYIPKAYLDDPKDYISFDKIDEKLIEYVG